MAPLLCAGAIACGEGGAEVIPGETGSDVASSGTADTGASTGAGGDGTTSGGGDDSSTSSTSGTTAAAADGPRPECTRDEDCAASGFLCVDNRCEDHCSSGGCWCRSHDGCYAEELCLPDEGQCSEVDRLPLCSPATTPSFSLLPEFPIDGDEIVSLSFVDVDGDDAEDLVVSRMGAAELYLGSAPQEPSALPAPKGNPILDVSSGDFDGDGATDLLAVTEDGQLTLMVADLAGGFAASNVTVVGPAAAFDKSQVIAIQFDDDGLLDLAVAGSGQSAILFGDGSGSFPSSISLAASGSQRIAISDVDGTPTVLGASEDALHEWHGGDDTDGSPDESWFGAFGVSTWEPAVSGSGEARLVVGAARLDAQGGAWTLLAGEGVVPEGAAVAHDADTVITADLDGDGLEDLALAGAGVLTFARRTADGIACAKQILPSTVEVEHLAVGDHTGDGRLELAVGSGADLTIWARSSS